MNSITIRSSEYNTEQVPNALSFHGRMNPDQKYWIPGQARNDIMVN